MYRLPWPQLRTTGWKSKFLHAAQSRSETEISLWVPFSRSLPYKQCSWTAAFSVGLTFFEEVGKLAILASWSNTSGEFTSEAPEEQPLEFFDSGQGGECATFLGMFDSVGSGPASGFWTWGEK